MEKTAFLLVGIFLVTQVLGLYVGNSYSQGIKAGELVPVVENPESVETSFLLFFYIIIATVVMLLIIRFWKNFIKALEAFIVFFSSWFVFDFLFPIGIWYFSLGFFLAIILTSWKMLRPTILNQNTAAVISGAGVGAMLGASLGIAPSIIFMLILSVYDFVSVFITKHMIYLAKALTERPTAFTVAATHKFKKPVYVGIKKAKKKFHVFQLGVGDIVMPLMFSVSVLSKFSLINAVLTTIGSAIALSFLIFYMSKKPRPLPALPFISLGALAGFLISILL